MADASETSAFGQEVQGRGRVTSTDLIAGAVMFTLTTTAILLGVLNVIAIKRLSVFHNAFGWFWATRTLGEIGSNIPLILYAVPMTILQPKDIPPELGIACYSISHSLAYGACVMHQIVSLNRCVAVCSPVRYHYIFSKRNCMILTSAVWIEVAIVGLLYHVFPCNLLGYSPQLYAFTYVKCSGTNPGHSAVGTMVNRVCFSFCALTASVDFITLIKIVRIHMRKVSKSVHFQREIRFFVQSALQNITMMVALTWIVWINNTKSHDTFLTAMTLDSIIIAHIVNALVLIVLNREVRSRFWKLVFFKGELSESPVFQKNAVQTISLQLRK
ncbi:hypothetical protein QR680_015837 [Steinernema hermaphroditum]|uniref:7TM GPCR serpentine receptor class x (Srx) domain-containing protein n=1 Tax=Steinernema hermaphroditum TaxID=289476 RepID=A0AA39H939_9BILA|nr:hypothetical protein QR680_015837 [Steinernema hermaphroditum]